MSPRAQTFTLTPLPLGSIPTSLDPRLLLLSLRLELGVEALATSEEVGKHLEVQLVKVNLDPLRHVEVTIVEICEGVRLLILVPR